MAGVRPGLAGRSATPSACTEGSGPCAPPSSRALPFWRMRDAELSACWTAACSMSACASRCKFRALGFEGAGMARSSVAAVMSLWLARWGVSESSTLKSALMRSRACFPNSRARSPRAEASPGMEARSNRTVRYSSASLASSSRAWASCALMPAPSVVRGEGCLAPQPCAAQFPGRGNLSVAGSRRVGGVCWVVGDHDAALLRGVVAPGARFVGVAEPVFRGVEESLEHH
jgi:hypothetical protein